MIARRRPQPRRGISLLEVLLAMAIFLITLAAISRLVDLGTDNALAANNETVAARLCQSKLAEAEAGAVPLSGSAKGTFDLEPDWEWTVDSTSASVANVYVVTVTVSRPFRGKTFSVSMSQMMFDPQGMGQAAEAQKPTTGTTP